MIRYEIDGSVGSEGGGEKGWAKVDFPFREFDGVNLISRSIIVAADL